MTVIEALVAIAGLALALAFMYPWALVVLPSPRSPVMLGLTTLALSAGALTLGMFALAWLAPGLLKPGVLQGGALLTFALGAWWLLKAKIERPPGPGALQRAIIESRRRPVRAAAAAITVAIGALALFNAVYWPFNRQDSIVIYGMLGRYIYYNHALPIDLGGDGVWHEAYPMLLPLAYSYAHMLAGGVNEYLARLVPALLSVGVLGATYTLGRALYDTGTGIVAALLLALTPTYAGWASAGYADLPAAFFFTLTAWFAWRHYTKGSACDAVLAGVMAGLAAWTKNSALILAGVLPLWMVYAWVRKKRFYHGDTENTEGRREGRIDIKFRHGAYMLGAMALVAGPWYLRNLALFGFVMPPTGWTWAAQRTPANLAPFLTQPAAYFVPGVVFTAGIGYGAWRALRGHSQAALLLIFGAPLFAAWWVLFSYEIRFLLLILPFAAALGGDMLNTLLQRAPVSRPATVIAIAALVALALPAAFEAVSFKDEILRNPLMSDAEKHHLQTGPAYEVAAFIDAALPPGAHVMTTLLYLPYYVSPDKRIDYNTWETSAEYWALRPEDALPGGVAAELLADIDGARVYRILGNE